MLGGSQFISGHCTLLVEMGSSGHIFRPGEIKNTVRSSDILISRRRYFLRCQFGLFNFLDHQTRFFKLTNVSSSLFSSCVVVLVLVTGIPDVYLLLTGTLVPFTTTSFHVTFELFNGIFSFLSTDYFQSFFPVFRHVVIFNTLLYWEGYVVIIQIL